VMDTCLTNDAKEVRFWHQADIARQVAMSVFGGKADMRCGVAAPRRSWMTQSGHERAAFTAMHGPDLLYTKSVIPGLGEST